MLLPLEDPRGDPIEHLRTWSHGQTLERRRYQLVLAADGEHPELERQASALLAPQDILVRAPGAPLMGLYEAGAKAAGAPVLVLTEAHCRADPGCLAAVAEAFAADPDLDAATLEYRQSASTPVGELSSRWLELVFDQLRQANRLRLEVAGSAIRREAYRRAGGLDPKLETFSYPVLSARLQEEGARVAHLREALVEHENQEDMRDTLALARTFAHGECAARRELDPEFCERHFGPAGLWDRRLAYRPEIARAIAVALASAARRSPGDARWLARELLAKLPATAAGSRPRRALERGTAAAHRAIAQTTPLPARARWRAFVAAQARTIRAVELAEGAREDRRSGPSVVGIGRYDASDLDRVLAGVNSLERAGGQLFRWTEPTAALLVAPPAAGAVLRIDTAGLRGRPSGYLHGVYAAGRPLPSNLISVDERTVETTLPAALAEEATPLVFISRPLVPSRLGSPDERRLGMPIAQVALVPP